MKYEIEWLYVDDPPPPVESEPYIHFGFLLRFPDVPPGKGHVAHFCFNVLQKPVTTEPGISVARRGFLISVPFSKENVQAFVESSVAKASEKPRDEALTLLNKQFINSDIDFSDEFAGDLVGADELLALIEDAFHQVERGDGITLHQAVVIDDYGSQDEFLAAARLDTEERWEDVPDSAFAKNLGIFNFFDPKGFRYYLPAAMSSAVRNRSTEDYDAGFYTYLAVLPTVAPREIGRGLGNAFDLNGFIQKHGFTSPEVNAIYKFICFMALRVEHGMDEDQYAAVKKWRTAAKS